ncbi:hypothetical protein YB2330_000981 [Saitoella coloradoensis]
MVSFGKSTLWKRLSPSQLNAAIQIFALLAIFFEGYDQGVMGGVNAAPDYIDEVGIGKNGVVTKAIHQGGIVAIYYLGAIIGCFGGGWMADRIGRIDATFYAAIFSTIGGALQAASISSDMILVSRVVSGLGTGALTGIIPVYCSEIANTAHRGRFLGLVFIANYLGISVAYWLAFGLAFVDNGQSALRWRFILAFQCIPALFLLVGIKQLPDSPRYLTAVGRHEEALDVLVHVRGGELTPAIQAEHQMMVDAHTRNADKHSNAFEVFTILFGMDKRGGHITRRAWLCVWLQIMASWTGITAVTVYSGVLFRQAGYSTITQDGLSGGVNSIGIIGTIISAWCVDRFGRRVNLMWGAFGLACVNFIAGGLYEAVRQGGDANRITPGAILMLFFFNLIYAATWGTIAFLYPTEIFPSEMRALGNGFGVTGWAIGCGWTTLVNPTIFDKLANRTYFFFGGLNVIWIPIIYLLYPETNNRTLESIEVLFSPASPFVWASERAYAQRELAGSPDAKNVERVSYELENVEQKGGMSRHVDQV